MRRVGRTTGATRSGTGRTQRPGTGRTSRRSSPKSSGIPGWAIAIIAVVVLSGIGLLFRLNAKSSDDTDVRRQMHELVHEASNYDTNRDYYDRLVDRCHEAAFESAYSLGGRHRANTFNVKRYLSEMARMMSDRAAADGRPEVQAVMLAFHQRLQGAVVDD